MYANAGPFAYPEMLRHLATTAERTGIESMWTIEHVVIPVGYKSTYPYDPSGKIPAPEQMPMPDPLISLAYAAAVTTKLRLATGILILPQRHPLYVAKEVADDAEPFEGKYFHWGKLECHPKPVQKPGVPIVVGGHTELAARRAARYGDGFFPGVTDEDKLVQLLGIMREECKKVGRDPRTIEVTSGRATPDADNVRRLEELGVSRFMVPPPAFDPDGVTQGLEKLGNLIAKL